MGQVTHEVYPRERAMLHLRYRTAVDTSAQGNQLIIVAELCPCFLERTCLIGNLYLLVRDEGLTL